MQAEDPSPGAVQLEDGTAPGSHQQNGGPTAGTVIDAHIGQGETVVTGLGQDGEPEFGLRMSWTNRAGAKAYGGKPAAPHPGPPQGETDRKPGGGRRGLAVLGLKEGSTRKPKEEERQQGSPEHGWPRLERVAGKPPALA